MTESFCSLYHLLQKKSAAEGHQIVNGDEIESFTRTVKSQGFFPDSHPHHLQSGIFMTLCFSSLQTSKIEYNCYIAKKNNRPKYEERHDKVILHQENSYPLENTVLFRHRSFLPRSIGVKKKSIKQRAKTNYNFDARARVFCPMSAAKGLHLLYFYTLICFNYYFLP